MVLIKVRIGQRIRGNPDCRICGANIKKLISQGKTIYGNKAWKAKTRYICAECYSDLYEGVKLRDE